MFNGGRSMGFIDDNDMPMKRGGFKVTLEIEEDDKHRDEKPTVDGFKEKVSHMLMPLIDMGEVEVDVKGEKETITIGDWKIIRPVVEVEIVPLEEVIADDLIPTL